MKTRQWNWGSKQLLRGVFILFLVAGTLACSEDDVTSTTPETPENPNGDGDTDPSVPESENQKVVVYADQSTGEVLFAASAQWTASVRTATRSGESTDWIDFEPKSGEAGENVILDLKLQLNTTGKDRSATIMVIADNDTTLLEVNQTTGKEAEQTIQKSETGKYLLKKVLMEGSKEFSLYDISYIYDKQNRPLRIAYKYNEWPEETVVFTHGENGQISEAFHFYDTPEDNFAMLYKVDISTGRVIELMEAGGEPDEYFIKYDEGGRVVESEYATALWEDGNMVKVGPIAEPRFTSMTYGNYLNNEKLNVDINAMLGMIGSDEYLSTGLLGGGDLKLFDGYIGKRSTNYMVTRKVYRDESYVETSSTYTYHFDETTGLPKTIVETIDSKYNDKVITQTYTLIYEPVK